MFVCFINKSLTNRVLLFHGRTPFLLYERQETPHTFTCITSVFMRFTSHRNPHTPNTIIRQRQLEKRSQMRVCELCKASSNRGRGRGSDMASVSTCWTHADPQVCVAPDKLYSIHKIYLILCNIKIILYLVYKNINNIYIIILTHLNVYISAVKSINHDQSHLT